MNILILNIIAAVLTTAIFLVLVWELVDNIKFDRKKKTSQDSEVEK